MELTVTLKRLILITTISHFIIGLKLKVKVVKHRNW